MTDGWDGDAVRRWLKARIPAARADQVAAQRGGRGQEDDCDAATAEEMVCALLLLRGDAAASQPTLVAELKALLERDEYVWRGVYDDRRFDRHARGHVRRIARMAKANEGFGNVLRYR